MVMSITNLQYYTLEQTEYIPKVMTNQVIIKLCSLLQSENASIYTPSAVILASSFVYDESPAIIDKAILEGVLKHFLNLLYTGGCSDLLHKILWGLSNITGGYVSHVSAFIQEEELVQRVLILIKNKSFIVKCEALYTIVNAI